jgi:hypothetical protein
MKPSVPPVYLPLHKYLEGRYAETVVLQIAQIEDLINAALPDVARADAAWWGNDGEAASATPQARSWTQAGRRASPNLAAGNVTFERIALRAGASG